jgi:dihydroorotase
MSDSGATYDLVLTGGTVVDPASGVNGMADVAISDGKIAAVGPGLGSAGTQVTDVSGKWVFPGLVEGHTHIFEYVSKVGANPIQAHLRRGVVAAADAGTAGASTFEAFRKLVIEPSDMRIVNFLNVSVLGLIDFRYGELLNPETLSVDDALATAAQYPQYIKGLKIRLSEDVVGDNMLSLLKKSIDLGEQAKLPLMVHIGETAETLPVILENLRPGDIIAHCYTGKPRGILEDETIIPEVTAARARGVLFDSAHGKSNLSFEVARRAIAQGFLPDIASSDTSARNWRGPVFDLLTSISKLVALGAPLVDIIERATIVPARLLGLESEGYGSLAVGTPAHVTVVEQTEEVELPDAAGNTMVAPRFEPILVLKDGVAVELVPWRGLAA